jgi:hypothetical protein
MSSKEYIIQFTKIKDKIIMLTITTMVEYKNAIFPEFNKTMKRKN